ncbi:hypothetical protein GW17_00037938 [Ensete ventricosum]|nr:hypothetical protein GW17_00037938 [Ensete ventricosum]
MIRDDLNTIQLVWLIPIQEPHEDLKPDDSTKAKFKNSIRSDYHRTIMPLQDQAPMKDADLEQMPMNLKEGDRYIVNHGEGLTTIDFGGGDAAIVGAIDRSEGKREKRCGRRLAVV